MTKLEYYETSECNSRAKLEHNEVQEKELSLELTEIKKNLNMANEQIEVLKVEHNKIYLEKSEEVRLLNNDIDVKNSEIDNLNFEMNSL